MDTLPAREMPTDSESVKQFRQRYRRRFEGNPAKSAIYREVSERRLPGGVENYLPLFFESTAVIWDYVADDALVICLGDADLLIRPGLAPGRGAIRAIGLGLRAATAAAIRGVLPA